MIVVCFFFEIFECVQRFRTLLNLVEDNQCLSRKDFFTGDHGQQLNDAVRIFIRLEDGFESVFLVEVEVNIALIAAPARTPS